MNFIPAFFSSIHHPSLAIVQSFKQPTDRVQAYIENKIDLLRMRLGFWRKVMLYLVGQIICIIGN